MFGAFHITFNGSDKNYNIFQTTRFNHTMIFSIILEKDHSMIETCRLKNVEIFIQSILSFVLSRKTYNGFFSNGKLIDGMGSG